MRCLPTPTTLPTTRRSALAPLIAAALLLGTLLPAEAQWVWRDKSGRVTASDLPPPREVSDKDILQRPDQGQRRPAPAAAPAAAAASAPAQGGGKAPVDPQLEARKRAEDAQTDARKRAEDEKIAQQRAENCRRARGQLAALEQGQRMARVNEKGEREVLDDKGRAEEMKRAQDIIASDCRPN